MCLSAISSDGTSVTFSYVAVPDCQIFFSFVKLLRVSFRNLPKPNVPVKCKDPSQIYSPILHKHF